jgi:hypothetical protein
MGLIHFDPSATRFCLSFPVHIISVHKLYKKRHQFQVPDFEGAEVQAPLPCLSPTCNEDTHHYNQRQTYTIVRSRPRIH